MKLAELMAANHTMLMMAGWGIQRQQYGEQKHWMLVTLAAMLEQIGTHRAAGLVSLIITQRWQPDACWRRTARNVCGGAGQASEEADDGGMTAIPVARIVDALENRRQISA